MVKVFTTGSGPGSADDKLNNAFTKWRETQPSSLKVLSVHSNSNQYGWMLVVHYEI